jgi:hypothetical protein
MNISPAYSPATHINFTTPTLFTYIPNHATTQTTPQPILPTTINHTSTQYEPNQSNTTTQTPQPPPPPPTTHTNTQTNPPPTTTRTSAQISSPTTNNTTQNPHNMSTFTSIEAMTRTLKQDAKLAEELCDDMEKLLNDKIIKMDTAVKVQGRYDGLQKYFST